MLNDLELVPWQSLRHAFGDAREVPRLLRELASNEREQRQTALKDLFACLLHQGSVYEATARAVLGPAHPFPWETLASDYDRVRERIARVIPGFEDMNRRVREEGGFVLPSAAGARAFRTGSGRAHFTVQAFPEHALPPDQLWLMTIRSHDQYNTTIYADDDRYRGVAGDRRVVFLNREEMAARGLEPGQPHYYDFTLTVPDAALPSHQTQYSQLWWTIRGTVDRALRGDPGVAQTVAVYTGPA